MTDGLSDAWRARQPTVVLALLYIAGATLVLAGVLNASWPDVDRGALFAIVGAAYAAGGALIVFVRHRPLPTWAAESLVAAGGLLVSGGVYSAGHQGAPVIAVFYIFVSGYAFFYFPAWHAVGHTVFAAATYALALWQLQAPSALSQWIVILGAAAVSGAVVGGLGAASRGRAESEHAAAEQLRTAEEVRTALLRAAGHDLRTPLATIAGFTETLLREELSDEDRRRVLERMRHNTGRIQRLLDDLLDLDRIESGHRTLATQDVDLQRLVDDALAGLEAPDHHLDVDVEAGSIRADPVMLERVLENLIGNAVKYSPAGTTITIEARRTERGAELTVADEGPGIPDEVRDGLFDPFVSGNHQRAGTGIGLYLVRQFVELHGGTVTAESNPGARFRIHLPERPPRASATPTS